MYFTVKTTMRKIDKFIDYFTLKKNPETHFVSIYKKYKSYTMIPERIYIQNLKLIQTFSDVKGCVVECGVWRGGMSAGIAELLNKKKIFLFDSFEGLPDAEDIDGKAALQWQLDTESAHYFDNCQASMEYATECMHLTGSDFTIKKGWFKDSLVDFDFEEPIAILRLDADWYDSTITCLEKLYSKVSPGGLIIIDDYNVWDGCSRAVHDYLSRTKSSNRIYNSPNGLTFLVK